MLSVYGQQVRAKFVVRLGRGTPEPWRYLDQTRRYMPVGGLQGCRLRCSPADRHRRAVGRLVSSSRRSP